MFQKNIIILLIVGILLFLSGCGEVKDEKVKDVKSYKSTILLKKDYKGSKLEKWIESCGSTGGYYEFINSDPDSWDVYIYYPNINPKSEYITYKVDMKIEENNEDRILKVYLTKQNADSDEQVVKDLVLEVQAPLRGAWPTKSEIYLDGIQVKCVGRDYQD